MKKKNNSITLTYIGIFDNPDKTSTVVLDELMRRFQSGKRFLRERIFENKDRKEAVDMAKPLFLNNVRYMRDAFLEAEASISSQKELLPLYLQQNNLKIKKLESSIEKLSKSKKANKEQRLLYIKNKVYKLEKQNNYYQFHLENGTVPKMVDGSKRRMELLKLGKITKQEWKESRSDAMYSRGEKSKGGNENIKISHLEDNLFRIAILNPLSAKNGDRITFEVRFPEKFISTLVTYLATGESYSVRLKRRNIKYEVHLTLEKEIQTTPTYSYGLAGMDINPDNLSVTVIYPNGNFRTSKVFWMHEINTVSANKRDWTMQDTIYQVIEWLKTFNIDTLVIEELKFLQNNINQNFNRLSSNFCYSSMTKSLVSICYKQNVNVVQVPPHYSSFIGKVKYQQTYGLSVHQAAAFVLARRGMGFKENVPQEILSVLFAKEAKKGQKCTDLFNHWKLVKKWFDEQIKAMVKKKTYRKGMLFRDVFIGNEEEKFLKII